MNQLDRHVESELLKRLKLLEKHFKGDCIFFYGEIYPHLEKPFKNFIEQLKNDNKEKVELLIIFINSLGGSVETVEKMVEIIRYHYSEVYFVVPEKAMSAGTILCMSGDKIYMDYASSLGPIDPQIHNGKNWVPALGYLDQVEKIIKHSQNCTVSQAELLVLQNQDLAMLNQCEQAKNLTITLLEKWLAQYKFKDWEKHRSNKEKKGKEVTNKEKEDRAKEIGDLLSDNKIWHSHARKISLLTLREKVKLEIEDYSENDELRNLIKEYNDFLIAYLNRHEIQSFLHSRYFF